MMCSMCRIRPALMDAGRVDQMCVTCEDALEDLHESLMYAGKAATDEGVPPAALVSYVLANHVVELLDAEPDERRASKARADLSRRLERAA